MVAIRLMRIGKKSQPYYRIVAQDARRKADGACLEILGTFDPRAKNGAGVSVRQDRVKLWEARGAAVSATVRALLKKAAAAG